MDKTTTHPKGAICSACSHRMLAAKGCVSVPVTIYTEPERRGRQRKSRLLEPIPYGKEIRYGAHTFSERCGDCGAKKDHFHHGGCDMEECPNCHKQLLMCGGECGVS